MLTFNVILGYQGLLFCDFLLFFLSFFFFQPDWLTQYQETHLTLNERTEEMGMALLYMKGIFFGVLAMVSLFFHSGWYGKLMFYIFL